MENASIALLAVDKLREKGHRIDRDLAVQALGEVRWPGRLELAPGFTPPLLLDCAHNPMGVRALLEFLEDMKWSKSVFLFTAMKDKNYAEMLSLIGPRAEKIVLCTVEPVSRCATMEDLTVAASKAGLEWTFEADATNAFHQATSVSKTCGLPLVAFGSIYFIGHLFRLLKIAT